MRERQSLYCDTGALDFLEKSKPTDPFPDEVQENKDEFWRAFTRMAFSSVIHVDCSLPELFQKSKTSRFHQLLYKSHTGGQSRLKCDADTFPKSASDLKDDDAEQLSSVFFITDKDRVPSFVRKGVCTITNDSFYKMKKKFDLDDKPFRSGEPANWNFLKKLDSPLNSMIIADRYIYNDMNLNLFKILDYLLPDELDVDFHLTVFTIDKDRTIESIYNSINEHLHKSKPKLSIKFSVFKCISDDFHSRNIITSQMWVDCDGGFDLLKEKRDEVVATKTASFDVWHPYMSKKKIEQYNNSLVDVKKVFDNRGIHKGEPVNRLFSLI